ncbi:sigma 54-interacting transcriptional regulator [Agrobacterium sp. 22094]|uniref:sigma 54-interacting transcriptional regulator n=1 Tax=Agrobacterium sp. 22094 TaxID=3453872 RepID=UPI003F839111
MKFYANDVASVHNRRLRPAFVDDLQFGTFLEALPDGVALLEADGRIKLVNNRLEILLNVARGDLVGSELGRHVKTAGPIIQKLWAAVQQLKRIEVSGALNSQRNVVASLSILRASDGGAYGALLVMRESTRHLRVPGGSDNFRYEQGVESGRSNIVRTPTIEAIASKAAVALERGASVLLTGETGTGKGELARLIGNANDAAFVHVRCGLLSEDQFEAEMFGVEPGSPLDTSTRGKLGYVEAADGGVLFLDQITDLSLHAQSKLVAFLETQTFSRLGSLQRRQARIKLVAATNQDLPALVSSGAFRNDLYYRIAVMTFAQPSLRTQPDLLAALIDHHLRRLNVGRKPPLRLSPEFLERLTTYSFPGNIRELANIMERAAAAAEDLARSEHFIAPNADTAPIAAAKPSADLEAPTNLKDLVQEFEAWVLEKSIAQNGSKRSAARALGIDIATLVRKTKRK